MLFPSYVIRVIWYTLNIERTYTSYGLHDGKNNEMLIYLYDSFEDVTPDMSSPSNTAISQIHKSFVARITC